MNLIKINKFLVFVLFVVFIIPVKGQNKDTIWAKSTFQEPCADMEAGDSIIIYLPNTGDSLDLCVNDSLYFSGQVVFDPLAETIDDYKKISIKYSERVFLKIVLYGKGKIIFGEINSYYKKIILTCNITKDLTLSEIYWDGAEYKERICVVTNNNFFIEHICD